MSDPDISQDEPLATDRQHPEEPAEGADEDQQQEPDVPRVHPEDPAEG